MREPLVNLNPLSTMETVMNVIYVFDHLIEILDLTLVLTPEKCVFHIEWVVDLLS